MVLCLFGLCSLNAFFAEITAFTGLIVLGVNTYLVFTYCKYTGTPYKNRKSFQSVRWVGLIGGVWSIAFAVKFLTVLLGHSLYQINSSMENQKAYQACLVGLCDFFSMIVPIFFISDIHFIKIFSAKHLNPSVKSQNLDQEDSLLDNKPVTASSENFGLRETQAKFSAKKENDLLQINEVSPA